jgi:hypothetical protein
MTHALILVALILSIIELVRGKGQSLLCWAVVLIALALAVPFVPLR